MDGLGKVIAVDIGDELKAQRAVAVKLEGLVGHDRTKVRTADTNVDHIADLFSGVAEPLAGADAIAKRCHFVEDLVDRGDDVFAIDDNLLAARRAQGGVQNGAVLRDIDLVATEHGIDPFAQTALSGQTEEQFERFVRDAILRVIEEDPASLGRQIVPPPGISGKKFAQVEAGYFRMMRLKGFPGRTVGQWFGAHARREDRTKNGTPIEYLNTNRPRAAFPREGLGHSIHARR